MGSLGKENQNSVQNLPPLIFYLSYTSTLTLLNSLMDSEESYKLFFCGLDLFSMLERMQAQLQSISNLLALGKASQFYQPSPQMSFTSQPVVSNSKLFAPTPAIIFTLFILQSISLIIFFSLPILFTLRENLLCYLWCLPKAKRSSLASSPRTKSALLLDSQTMVPSMLTIFLSKVKKQVLPQLVQRYLLSDMRGNEQSELIQE